jgi:predicted acyltransferase
MTQGRIVSLDAARGVAIIGMVVVNTADCLKDFDGFAMPRLLLHAGWAGFTVADAVFPAFIFIVGVSIALALNARPRDGGLTWNLLRRITVRTLWLIAIGLVVSNLGWLARLPASEFRFCGVLQRIAIVYFVTAILFLSTGTRTRIALIAVILLGYWPLTLRTLPAGQPTDLLVAGADYIAWFDRAVLGPYVYVAGPSGYDPEGILSTLPAIAQCLMGVVVGEWLLSARSIAVRVAGIGFSGCILVAIGLLWAPYFPIVKNIWTSSFVLLSSGPTMILLSLLYWGFDARLARRWAIHPFVVFGSNPIVAYLLHIVMLGVLALVDIQPLYAVIAPDIGTSAAGLFPIPIVLALLSLPLEYLYRQKRVLRL